MTTTQPPVRTTTTRTEQGIRYTVLSSDGREVWARFVPFGSRYDHASFVEAAREQDKEVERYAMLVRIPGTPQT